MIQQTKIQFLPAEMELVSSPGIILTKNAILQKIKSFFEELQFKQQDILNKNPSAFPGDVIKIRPKISRGENYKGLPWLVLDNPRYFQHNNIFAIRTMFWWGNFFSITLHVSGNNKAEVLEKMSNHFLLLGETDFHIYTGQKEWEHDMDPEAYKRISSLNKTALDEVVNKNSFLKLAVKFPIDSLEAIEDKLLRNYELLVKCCC